MSKTATQAIAHALLLANDTTFSATDAAALLDELYQRYWSTFLKDRVKTVASFVSFSSGEYVKTNAVAAREILSLGTDMTGGLTLGATNRAALTRDEFEAVCSDCEQTNALSDIPLRWGAYKNQGDSFWRIAIFPGAEGALIFEAEILPEYVTPTGSASLEGDDVDAFNVARLTAIEIMVRNGDDASDIQAVWAPLDQAVKDKFQYVLERSRPNEHPQKEQV